MSEELDDVELYELIILYLRSQETLLPLLTNTSKHLYNGERDLIVEWICHTSEHFKVSVSAQHLSVALFDYFIDCHNADHKGLYLVGAACLSIACKVEDIEIHIPQASKLMAMIPLDEPLPICYLKNTELKVLQYFDWKIHLPTEASFIDYYSASCLGIELEDMTNVSYNRDTLTRYYNKWISYFRKKTLLMKFRPFRPSLIACAIVAASRISLFMQPDWPTYMTQITEIKRSDLNDVIHILLSCVEEDRVDQQVQKTTTFAELSTSCHNKGDIVNNNLTPTSSYNIPMKQSVSSSPLNNSSGSSQSSTPLAPNQPQVLPRSQHLLPITNPISMSGDQTWAPLAPARLSLGSPQSQHPAAYHPYHQQLLSHHEMQHIQNQLQYNYHKHPMNSNSISTVSNASLVYTRCPSQTSCSNPTHNAYPISTFPVTSLPGGLIRHDSQQQLYQYLPNNTQIGPSNQFYRSNGIHHQVNGPLSVSRAHSSLSQSWSVSGASSTSMPSGLLDPSRTSTPGTGYSFSGSQNTSDNLTPAHEPLLSQPTARPRSRRKIKK